jgi:eukaryotic-like serine/threonine-protein kinase
MRDVVLGGGVTVDDLSSAEAQRTTLTSTGFAATYLSTDVTHALELHRLSMAPPRVPGLAAAAELEVKGVLGVGGMGRVLLALQGSLGREVAVKVVKTPGDAADAVLVNEALLTGGLEHPGIVPVHALASDEHGHPALVMKRVDGVSWRELLDEADHPMWRRLPPTPDRLDTHLGFFMQVCNAIAFAHQRGVLHRDLKPANVLIGEFGEVYVADWGLAMRHGTPQEICLVGTPAYLAPEMVSGDAALVSERTDVFLLGAVLYELLSGRPPWQAPSLRELLEQVSSGTPPPLPAHAPSGLREVCLRAMAARPEGRYASVLELRDAISQALRHRSSVSITAATQARLAALTASVEGHFAAAEFYPLLSECRFGFTQALREWPENAAAARGLEVALETGVRFEVRRGHGAAARALLSEFPRPHASLEALVDQAEREEARLAADAHRLDRVARQLDPRIARRPRAVMFALLVVMVSLFAASRLVVPGLWKTTGGPAVASAAFLALFLLGLTATKRLVLSTRINRQLALLVVVMLTSQLVHRVIGFTFDKPVLLSEELVVIGACAAAGGVAFHWSFFIGAALLWLGSFVAAFRPDQAERLFTASSIAALLVVGALSLTYWKSELGEPASQDGSTGPAPR